LSFRDGLALSPGKEAAGFVSIKSLQPTAELRFQHMSNIDQSISVKGSSIVNHIALLSRRLQHVGDAMWCVVLTLKDLSRCSTSAQERTTAEAYLQELLNLVPSDMADFLMTAKVCWCCVWKGLC
jgi:hypothetical protein